MARIYTPRGTPLPDRLKAYSVPVASGCIEWSAQIDSRGYGRIKVEGKPAAAYRVAYEVEKGPIPEGMEVCHKCDNTRCINPDHLFLGTHKENMHDMWAKGRARPRGKIAALRAHAETK